MASASSGMTAEPSQPTAMEGVTPTSHPSPPTNPGVGAAATTTTTAATASGGGSSSTAAAADKTTPTPPPPSSSSSDPQPFVVLPYHGEHRRAVSAVAFAPTHPQSPFSGVGGGGGSSNIRRSGTAGLCASASADGTVKFWNITHAMIDGALGGEAASGKSGVEGGTDAADGVGAASGGGGGGGGGDGAADEHDSGAEQQNLPAPSSSSSKEVAGDSRALSPLVTLAGHSRGINDVSWSRTAEYVATASDDKTLRIWDSTTGDALVEFRGHTNFVFSCAFNPQSNLLVSGSFDETVKLWDVRSGDCVSTLPAHSDPVTGVDFNRDGTCLVSGSHDGLIRIWDTMTGECLKTIYAGGNPPVSFVKFSPNGKFVLSGTLDSTLRLWRVGDKGDAPDGGGDRHHHSGAGHPNGGADSTGGGHHHGGGGARCTKTYVGHSNSKFCTFSAFSVSNPKRHSIISGSEDGAVYVYDLQSRGVRQVLRAHSDSVLAVAAHDRREILASGGMTTDRTVRFWVPGSLANGTG